jgi:Glyoxalase/Bleomycin resistance protein/Dioxygenase superfamily
MTLPNGFLEDVSLICFVCGDLDAAVERYAADLGVGPWEVFDFAPPVLRDTEVAGRPCDYSMRVAFAAVGEMGWALLEPKSGPTIYADFLRRQGAGLHHAGFLHPRLSYDACIREFRDRGFALVQRGDYCGRFCYFGTRERAHLIFELVENPEAVMTGMLYRHPASDAGIAKGAGPLFRRTVSVGLVTGDLDATLAVYAGELGIGPWSLYEPRTRAAPRRAVASIGRCLWELVEPGQGPSSYRERLDRAGAGAHHVGVAGARLGYEDTRAHFQRRGIGSSETAFGGPRACYLETAPIMGVKLKLIEGDGPPILPPADRRYPAE